jgi:hypothetical protein
MRSVLVACLLFTGCVEVDEGATPELGESAAPLSVCGGSVQAAIDAAPNGAIIDLCAGTYPERLTIDGKWLTLRGAGASSTIIDAGGLGRALTVRSSGGTVTLRNLTFRNGTSSSSGGAIACRSSTLYVRDSTVTASRAEGGGGLDAQGCSLDLARSRFEGNDAGGGRGGGLLATSSTGVVSADTFTDNDAFEGGGLAIVGGAIDVGGNTIEGNRAHRGAGIFLGDDGRVHDNRIANNDAGWTAGGVYFDVRTGTFEDNVVDGNTAVNDGGGIYVHQGAPVLLDNVVTGNYTGDDGGGVRVFESRARLERNRVEGNEAADSGGGIRVSHLPATMIDNLVRDNVAELGGGMDLDNDSSVVRGGEVTGNRAVDGGGISAALGAWLGATIERVVIADNVASGRGGGIYLGSNYKPWALRHLTVTGNRAATGGGLYAGGTDHTLTTSVFARNTATGDGGAIFLASPGPNLTPAYDFLTLYANTAARGSALRSTSALTFADSIIAGHAGVAVSVSVAPTWRYNDSYPASFAGMIDPTGTSGNLAVDPLLADPANGDVALASGSPARDAGDPDLRDRDGSRADLGVYGGPDGDASPTPPPPPPPGATATLDADTYVAAATPDTGFGAATSLFSDGDPLKEAYVRFEISGLTAAPTRARLRVTVTDASSNAPAVYLADSAWTEATLTWNTRPARAGGVLADVGATSLGQVVEYDVTAAITGDGPYTFDLAPTSTSGFGFSSREGSAPPVLILE